MHRYPQSRFARLLGAVAALSATLAGPGVGATLIQHNLQFGTFDQSPFQPGRTFSKNESTLIGPSWDTPLSPGDLPPIGPLYLTPTLQTKGRFGAELGFAVSGGDLDIRYPVSATIQVPDSVRLAAPFTVSSSVSLNPAGFSLARATLDANPLLSPWVSLAKPGGGGYLGPTLDTQFPQAVAWLDLVAQLENRISATATYPALVFDPLPAIESRTTEVLDLRLPGFDVRMPLFELNANGIQTAIPGVSLPFGTGIPILKDPVNGASILTTTFNYPNLATDARLEGTQLRSGGEQTVAGLDMNVLQLLGQGFPLLKALEGSIDVGIGQIDYTLLRLTAGLALDLRQDFLFSATPTAFLYFDTPVSVISGGSWSAPTNLVTLPASGDLQLGFPDGRGGGPIGAQLSYALFNQLATETSLVLKGNLKATALEANLALDLGIVEINEGFGPLFGPEGPEAELARFKICCDAPAFQVNFTPVFTKPFEVDLLPRPRSTRARLLTRIDDGSAIYEIQEFAGIEFPGGRLNLLGREYPSVGGGSVFLSDLDAIFDGRNYGRLFCVVCVDADPDPLLVSSNFAVDGGGNGYINDLLRELFAPPADPPCAACLDDFLAAHAVTLDGATNGLVIALNRLPEIFPIESLPGGAVPLPGTGWLVTLALALLAVTRRRVVSHPGRRG